MQLTSRRAFLIGSAGAFGAFLFRPASPHKVPPKKTTTTAASTTTTTAARTTTIATGTDPYTGSAYGGNY